jgi:hypothetical protein
MYMGIPGTNVYTADDGMPPSHIAPEFSFFHSSTSPTTSLRPTSFLLALTCLAVFYSADLLFLLAQKRPDEFPIRENTFEKPFVRLPLFHRVRCVAILV